MKRCPGACLENEVVNPAFDTMRIRDELIYQTKRLLSLVKITFPTYCFHNTKAGISTLLPENEILED